MRILILGTLMDSKQGGANQALLLFANRLAKHPSLEPIVLLYSYTPELLDPSIRVIRYRVPRSYRFFWRFPSLFMVSQFREELEQSNLPEVDVAVCCSPHLAAAYKKLRPHAPLITYFGAVLSAREVIEEFPASNRVKKIEAWLSNRIEGRVYRQPKCKHLAQTKLVARTREEHFGLPRGFFTVCPGGVDDERFSRGNVTLDVRARYNIPSNAFVVVAVARLVPWKRVDMVIDAVAQMGDDVYLLIVGDGPEREFLETRAAQSKADGRIIFAGWVHMAVDWLAAADIFVLTSRIESFGLVYAEAMMMGLPCIGSTHEPPEVTSSASDVIPEGEAGFCVDSEETLVERLRLLKENPELRRQVGRNAEQLARNRYAVGKFIECIERAAKALNQ